MADHVRWKLVLGDVRDLPTAIARCRRLLDLDADPEAVTVALSEDPTLAPLVAITPSRRIPGAASTGRKRRCGSCSANRCRPLRLFSYRPPRGVARHAVVDHAGSLTHLFPSAQDLRAVDPDTFAVPAAAASLPHRARGGDGRRHGGLRRWGQKLGAGPTQPRRPAGHPVLNDQDSRHACSSAIPTPSRRAISGVRTGGTARPGGHASGIEAHASPLATLKAAMPCSTWAALDHPINTAGPGKWP
ncbi:MAG: AlkA N-terminal domain-containing protein [Acidimicrobiales bacterium]